MDKRTENTLLNAVDRAKADRKHLQMKQEEQVWKKLNNPCNLIDALSSLTKIELDRVRKNLGVKGVSVLKKSELVSELAKIIPSQFEHLLYQLDHERYDLIKKIVNNSGSVTADDFPFSKIKSLKEYSIIFPGTYLNQKVLFMPSELIEIFPKIDGTKLQTTVDRNTEWIRLTHGMLYYYGVFDTGLVIDKIIELSGQEVQITEYLDVISIASDYYRQVSLTYIGLKDHRVFDASKIFEEQQMRASIDYYPFTKKQLLLAGKPEYVEKSVAMNNFFRFLLEHFDLSKREIDEIALQLTNLTLTDSQPMMLIQFLQSKLEFSSFEFLQELTGKIIDLSNNSRMWVLKGHTPKELAQEEKKHLRPLPSAPYFTDQKSSKVVQISDYMKVGRNDPCPCGSGKKYKKCCKK